MRRDVTSCTIGEYMDWNKELWGCRFQSRQVIGFFYSLSFPLPASLSVSHKLKHLWFSLKMDAMLYRQNHLNIHGIGKKVKNIFPCSRCSEAILNETSQKLLNWKKCCGHNFFLMVRNFSNFVLRLFFCFANEWKPDEELCSATRWQKLKPVPFLMH